LKTRLARRALSAVAAAIGLGFVALVAAVARKPLPAALARRPEVSVVVTDRGGRMLYQARTRDDALVSPVRVEDVSPWVVPALLAAEDGRFYSHPGADPIAMLRAFAQLVLERRLVSGASTLTQQLARNVAPRPRTVFGKLDEIVTALRIERELDKQTILSEYLTRIEFGPNIRGVEAASQRYFDKPARALDLSEAATLAAIPRGPTLYDPERGLERVERRRVRILKRLSALDLVEPREIERALATRVTLSRGEHGLSPNQLVLGLVNGLDPALGAPGTLSRIETTIDAALQEETTVLARRAVERVAERHVTSAAVVVLDNDTGDVLAWVGSPDFFDRRALGQNDGIRALRQPGSTLKPFLYAAAMERLGLTAASLLPDLPLAIRTEQGTFSPQNYDRRSHGPVRVREALASSFNQPAVALIERLGVERGLEALRDIGFSTLTREASHYGAALALGDGEVRLVDLARAYATLARGGRLRRERLARAVVDRSGTRREHPPDVGRRVLDPRVAAIVTDVLADASARAPGFGRDSVLELPFPVAAKTGTSKGYRDNWAVGFTREITVAVWVGNFDGSPMVRSSGITGAAPLFHDVMLAAMRGRSQAALVDRSGLLEREVCALSGALPGDHCAHRHRELFLPGSEPHARCEMHELVPIDRELGGRSALGCPSVEARVYERYPAEYAAWARGVGRPLAPTTPSARCSAEALERGSDTTGVSIEYPHDGAVFRLDPELGRQEIVLSARAPEAAAVSYVLNGRVLATVQSPFQMPWALEPGAHRLEVRVAGAPSGAVAFRVE
jgi:penicillin-binding protein 1C